MFAFRPARAAGVATLVATLSAISGSAWAQAVNRSVAVGNEPRAVAVDTATNRIYVANEFSNTVTVIDGGTHATTTVPVSVRPQYLAVNPATNRIYVSHGGDSTQTVIDGATLATTSLATGSNGPMLVDTSRNTVYVVRLGNADEVTRIDGTRNTWYTMAIESYAPVAQVLDERANRLYTANYATGDVRMVDLNSTSDFPPTKSVPVWTKPVALAHNPNTNRIYVVGEDARGPINVVDTATMTAVTSRPRGTRVARRRSP